MHAVRRIKGQGKIVGSSEISQLALVFLGGHFSTCFGAAGVLDTSFGGTGMVTLGMGGGRAQCYATAVQSDGKLILAGYSNPKAGAAFDFSNGGDFILARFNTNNSLDTTFGKNGVVVTQVSTNYPNSASSRINALLVQSDGKIVAGGYSYQKSAFQNTNYTDFTLVRYNTNGTVDTSFGSSGTGIVIGDIGKKTQINGLALQFGTNIVVAGFGDTDNGVSDRILRWDLQQQRQAGHFRSGHGIGNDLEADAVVTECDGSILVAGAGVDSHGSQGFMLAHYTAGGFLDSTFTSNGIVFTPITAGNFYHDYCAGIALQSAGVSGVPAEKIVVAGTYESFDAPFLVAEVALRYNLDGTLDSTFGNNGIVTNVVFNASPNGFEQCAGMVVQGFIAQPRTITVGASGSDGTHLYATVARLTVTGAPDTTFGTNNSGSKIAINLGQPNGAQEISVNSMVLQSGNYVLGGFFEEIAGDSLFLAGRFTSSGLVDTSFGTNGVLMADVSDAPGAQANGVALQPDGKIVVAGASPLVSDVEGLQASKGILPWQGSIRMARWTRPSVRREKFSRRSARMTWPTLWPFNRTEKLSRRDRA